MLHVCVERFDVMCVRGNILGWEGKWTRPKWEAGSAAPCGCWRLLVSAVRLLTVVVVTWSTSRLHVLHFSIPGEADGWPACLRQEMKSSYGVRERLIGENYVHRARAKRLVRGLAQCLDYSSCAQQGRLFLNFLLRNVSCSRPAGHPSWSSSTYLRDFNCPTSQQTVAWKLSPSSEILPFGVTNGALASILPQAYRTLLCHV
jgi:hypothetical protein